MRMCMCLYIYIHRYLSIHIYIHIYSVCICMCTCILMCVYAMQCHDDVFTIFVRANSTSRPRQPQATANIHQQLTPKVLIACVEDAPHQEVLRLPWASDLEVPGISGVCRKMEAL